MTLDTSRSSSRSRRASRELSVPARMVASRSTASPAGSSDFGACQPMARWACCSGRSTSFLTTPGIGRGTGIGVGLKPGLFGRPKERSAIACTARVSTGPATTRVMFSGV